MREPTPPTNPRPEFGNPPISAAKAKNLARQSTHRHSSTLVLEHPRTGEEKHFTFPDPPITEREDGRRFITAGEGTYVYDAPSSDPNRRYRGRLETDFSVEYLERVSHPNPEMMPSLRLGPETPVRIVDDDGNVITGDAIFYADRKGRRFDGMIREEREDRKKR